MKKTLAPSAKIFLAASAIPRAGRGVFARKHITKGEIIEACPVYVIQRSDYPLVKHTTLRHYYFMWGSTTCAICLGFGSLYNHSYTPNATYIKKFSDQTIEFVALTKIKKGQEITVNYNYGDPNNKRPLWIPGISPE